MDTLVTAADEIEKVSSQFEGGLSRILSNLKTAVSDGAASGSLSSSHAVGSDAAAGPSAFGGTEHHHYQQLGHGQSGSKDSLDVLHSHLAVNQSCVWLTAQNPSICF
jgi:hypothetical protein